MLMEKISCNRLLIICFHYATKKPKDYNVTMLLKRRCQMTSLDKSLKSGKGRLLIYVYNHCILETYSGRSWPSRSIAIAYSNNLLCIFHSIEFDIEFVTFENSGFCNYRDLVSYAKMRNIIVKFEIENIVSLLNGSICYSMQIDDSSVR